MTSRLNILIRRNFHRSRRVQSSITPFKLADIGEGITEVELMKWFVKAGDKVKSFDRLCEVQSDKATVEITSRYDGVIESIHHEEGAIVKVGDALVDIKTLEVSSPKLINTEKVEMQSIEQTASIVTFETSSRDILSADGSKSLATPAVRKIAKERGLDLSRLVGSGPKGRVLKEDVLRVNGGAPFSRPSHSTFQTAPKQSVSSPTFDQPTYSQPTKIEEAVHINIPNHGVDTKVPIRGIQRIMVASMNAACEVQHLTLGEEIVFDKMISLKRELSILLKSQHPNSSGKISFLPFLIKAASLSLQRYPVLNATVNKEATEMILHHNHNIGVAMDTPKGLLVPVIDRVQDKSIFEIASDLTKLQADAATGNISEKQLRGGTFSLSNIGSIGGTYAVPVLLVPQVAIGALGRVQTVPRYVSKKTLLPATLDEIHSDEAIVKPQSIMNVSWSADHRVIDGATVARFSNMFKSYVEKPEQMLANMR